MKRFMAVAAFVFALHVASLLAPGSVAADETVFSSLSKSYPLPSFAGKFYRLRIGSPIMTLIADTRVAQNVCNNSSDCPPGLSCSYCRSQGGNICCRAGSWNYCCPGG